MVLNGSSVVDEQIRLNLFHLALRESEPGEAIRRFERDPDFEQRLRRNPGVGLRYRVFGEGGGFYVWARPGGKAPDAVGPDVPTAISALPASVVAHCAGRRSS